jgi:hypothetical protein
LLRLTAFLFLHESFLEPALGLPDERVGEEDEIASDGLVADEAPAGPEHDWLDHQPQLVGEVVL